MDCVEVAHKNNELREQVLSFKRDLEELSRGLKGKEQKLQDKQQQLKVDKNSLKQNTVKLEAQHAELRKNNFVLNEKNNALQDELERLTVTYESSQEQLAQQRPFLTAKQEHEEALLSRLTQHSQEKDRLIRELTTFRAALNTIKAVYSRFSLKKVTRVLNFSAALVVRENGTVLELFQGKSKKTYSAAQLENVEFHL